MEYRANRRVEASVRTFALVEHLRSGRAQVSTLANELGMSKGIVHNHLSTLRELGYVHKVGEEYQLSGKFLSAGFEARSNTAVYQFTSDLIEDFANQFDTCVVLAQRGNTECTVIESCNVPAELDLHVGAELPLDGSILGLVMFAGSRLDRERLAERSEYDVEETHRSIDENGYVVGPVSAENTCPCLAFPIIKDGDRCSASVGITVPDVQDQLHRERVQEAAVSLRERIEMRFRSGWTEERSFVTEKHSWVGG